MGFPDSSATDFRSFLQSELINRCKKNRQYSLRAFARSLEFESSTLSKILSGRRKITEVTLLKIGRRLGLDPERLEAFRAGITNPKPETERQQALLQTSIDAFRFISDWYHFAILELMTLENFEPNPKWVARNLDITVSEVNIALGNLTRLGIIEITPEGKWISKSPSMPLQGDFDIEVAQRTLKKQILEKAIEALEAVERERKDHSVKTFAVNANRIEEARARVATFHEEMATIFKQDQVRDQVYHLAIALFPVTKTSPIKKIENIQ